jgi:hypothetical protein
MGTPWKLAILLIANLLALGYRLGCLMKPGNTYRQALRIAWDLIILNQNEDINGSARLKTGYYSLLRRTWWLMIFLYLLNWIIFKTSAGTISILVLLLLHVYWYIHANITPEQAKDQLLFLNDNWGIIYREVDCSSGLDQKSLAELNLRKKNLLVLAIERDGQLVPFPKGLEVLKAGDRVLLFGSLSSFQAMSRLSS